MNIDLAKKMFRIEGIKTKEGLRHVSYSQEGKEELLYTSAEDCIPYVQCRYDPFSDKAKLWELRKQYSIEIDDYCKICRIWKGLHTTTVTFYDITIEEAMIQCIVDAYESGVLTC